MLDSVSSFLPIKNTEVSVALVNGDDPVRYSELQCMHMVAVPAACLQFRNDGDGRVGRLNRVSSHPRATEAVNRRAVLLPFVTVHGCSADTA